MDKLVILLKRHKTLTILALITFLVFLSHGKTWQMYFWVDDWAMTYKVLWPEESLTNMARGIYGTGPYRYLITPFAFLYPLFRFEAFPYFFAGWIIYLFAAFAVYLLTFELTEKRSIAASASAIFASGYIGAHALYRLTNSYQTAGGALFIILSVWLFTKYLKDGKAKLYWAALTLYAFSIELFFIRTHGLFLSILGVSLLYKLTERTKLSYKSLLLKQLPFLAIFYFMYFLDPRIKIYSNLVLRGMNAILKKGEIWLFNNFNINYANALIPDGITVWVYTKLLTLPGNISPNLILFGVFILGVLLYRKSTKTYKSLACVLLTVLYFFSTWSSSQQSSLWNPRDIEIFTSILGEGLIVFFLYLGISLWQRKEHMGLLVLYLVSWIVANTITLFIYSPETNLESTSRYFVPAFASIGMLYGVTFWLTLKKPLAILSTTLVCLTLLYFSNKEADTLLNNVSIPDKQGYGLIRSEVKEINKNTVFFIESEDDPKYKNNYLGRLPQLGISSLLNYHGVTTLAYSYTDLFSRLANGETKPDDIHTYFFGRNGYVSTTSKFKGLLNGEGKQSNIGDWTSNTPYTLSDTSLKTKTLVVRNVALRPVLESAVSYDSVVPSVVELTLTASPLKKETLTFPFYDVSQEFSPSSTERDLEAANPKPWNIEENYVTGALMEESQKQNYYKNVRVSATSSVKTVEPRFAVDGLLTTYWGADNTAWNNNEKPQELYLDLGSIKSVGNVTWINHHYMATPTDYQILTSLDGSRWNIVKSVKNGPRKDGGEKTLEIFPVGGVRFIKISVNETYGGNGYPPGIDEIWTTEMVTGNKESTDKVLNCPFCYAQDGTSYEQRIKIFSSLANLRLWWRTDRGDNYSPTYSKKFSINPDGKSHVYRIYLPAQGTKLLNLKLDNLLIPSEVVLDKAVIRSLSLEEAIQSRSSWDTGE